MKAIGKKSVLTDALLAPNDGLCEFQDAGSRCPLSHQQQARNNANERTGPRLCVGHFTLRGNVGHGNVFLKLVLENRHPFVPAWNDALMARHMFEVGNRKSVEATYGPRMIAWLQASPEHGKHGGTWQRDYSKAVREAVKAEQMAGAPA